MARADRFRSKKDRVNFIAARGILRGVLGLYLNTAPADIEFSYGAYGKPAIGGSHRDANLFFNVSHSHEIAAFAIARGIEIGIDIEHITKDFEYIEIAKHYYSSREVSELLALPPHQQVRAFYNCWKRKEAYVKARATGFALPLDQFEVS